MTLKACRGFLVLQPIAFYNLAYKWRMFFDEEHSATIVKEIKKGYALHLWHSKMNREGGDVIRPASKQPIALLEKEYCPVVYSHTHDGPYIPIYASLR